MATALPIQDGKKITLLSKLLYHSERDSCLFLTGINVGLRGIDLLALNAGDVRKLKANDVLPIVERKTGKSRDVFFNAVAVEAIQRLLASKKFSDTDPLFQNRFGRRLTRKSLGDFVKRWCGEAGLTLAADSPFTYSSHTLRKTMAHWMYRNGGRLTDIMLLLNHQAPAQTLTYIHVNHRDVIALHEHNLLGRF